MQALYPPAAADAATGEGALASALTDLDVSKNQLGAAACSALLLPAAAAAAARATTHSAGVTAVAEGLKRLNLFGARTLANNRFCVFKRTVFKRKRFLSSLLALPRQARVSGVMSTGRFLKERFESPSGNRVGDEGNLAEIFEVRPPPSHSQPASEAAALAAPLPY